MRESGIYQIKNTESGKIYIGSAVYIVRRFTEHKRQLKLGIHNNRILQRAWNKYGANAFEFSVLEVVADAELLIEREQFWIDSTKCFERANGYNLSPTAYSNLGYRFSDEQKARLSNATKGKSKSAEHRANLWKNREKTPEFLAQMSANGKRHIGRKITGLHSIRKSLAQTGEKNHRVKLTDEQVKTIKRRLESGELGRVLANEFKVRESLISRIKNGKRRATVL